MLYLAGETVVKQKVVGATGHCVDTSSLAPGIYAARIEMHDAKGQDRVFLKKLVVVP